MPRLEEIPDRHERAEIYPSALNKRSPVGRPFPPTRHCDILQTPWRHSERRRAGSTSRRSNEVRSADHSTRPFGWLIAVAGFLCLAVPLAWATLVIYYSNLPWAGVRIGFGDRLRGVRNLGALVLPPTPHVRVGRRAVFRSSGLVDLHPSLARSQLGDRSRRHAARHDRWRSRALDRRPDFRVPLPNDFTVGCHGA